MIKVRFGENGLNPKNLSTTVRLGGGSVVIYEWDRLVQVVLYLLMKK